MLSEGVTCVDVVYASGEDGILESVVLLEVFPRPFLSASSAIRQFRKSQTVLVAFQ